MNITHYKIFESNPFPSTSAASIMEIKASLSILFTEYLNSGNLDICTIQYKIFLSLPVRDLPSRMVTPRCMCFAIYSQTSSSLSEIISNTFFFDKP